MSKLQKPFSSPREKKRASVLGWAGGEAVAIVPCYCALAGYSTTIPCSCGSKVLLLSHLETRRGVVSPTSGFHHAPCQPGTGDESVLDGLSREP